MTYLGDYSEGSVVYHKWHTSDQGGASITRGIGSPGSPNDAGDIRVYKDDSLAQYGSPGGIDDILDFDDITGVHHVTIDTGADEFYTAGSDYHVVVVGAEIDGQIVNAVICTFSIENRHQA
jgi:hypothetical protein